MSDTVRVVTYENPYTFHLLPDFQPYMDTVHICASSSLAQGVKRKNRILHAYSIGELMKKFYPRWNDTEHRFNQYSLLSDLLRDWEGEENSKVIRSFKRNKLNLLITMRNLTEIGLRPDDILDFSKKKEEKLFCDVWEKMIPGFTPYMVDSERNLKDYETIFQVFLNEDLPIRNKTIVLHGFYYISPGQHFVFSKWKEAGFELVFINLYNEQFPEIFSFLDENFSEKYGWAKRDNWTLTTDPSTLRSERFASVLQGNVLDGKFEGIHEKSYEYMIEFVGDLEDGVHYVSPSNDQLQERIREFRPEAYEGESHFLSYPIGQYLLHLHSISNEDKGDYFLNDKILMECFSSGWLNYGTDNARDYTEQLNAILPYFRNCETIDEWRDQMLRLQAAKKSSSRSIRKNQLKKTDHFKAVRINPVLRFSFFSVTLKDLNVIKGFLEKLISDAKWLVNIENERITIKTHFDRVKKLLDESGVKNSFLGSVERDLVNQLEGMLMRPVEDGRTYHVSDLAEAIVVYLKNGFELELEKENEMNDQKVSIQRLEQLDGLILLNEGKGLHLCGMDEKHFPEDSSPMPWPLSEQLIQRLNRPATDMYLYRKGNQGAFAKYLFYLALCYEGQISISWIKNWDIHEQLERSVYVQLLGLEKEANAGKNNYQYMPINIQPNDIEMATVQNKLLSFPREEFVEMYLCQRRFYYSSVVNGYSSYRSPFHQEFLVGNLVKIYAASGQDKSEIIEILEGLFPYLTRIRLRFIVEENLKEYLVQGMRKYGLGRRLYYENLEYPMSTMYFQFLTHHGAFQNERWKGSFELMNNRKVNKQDMDQFISPKDGLLVEAAPSELCKLCPHNEYCEDALYSVDISKKGFDDIE